MTTARATTKSRKAAGEPAWVRPLRVLGALGQWEAVLRDYLVRYHRKDPWLQTRDHWTTILTDPYSAWYDDNKAAWERANTYARGVVQRERARRPRHVHKTDTLNLEETHHE